MSILTVFIGCKEDGIKSAWIEEPVKIDGQATEWANLPKQYDEDSGVSLGISNDAENLYLLFLILRVLIDYHLTIYLYYTLNNDTMMIRANRPGIM